MSKSESLHYLVIHCTATAKGKPYTKDDVLRWHTAPKHSGGRGWTRPGYSDMIYLDGKLVNLIPFNTDDIVDPWEISNGIEGINGKSRHIVYVGGLDTEGKKSMDTRTDIQKHTMEVYVKYMVLRHPDIKIFGHNQALTANGKACPSFNVPEWLRQIGIGEKNIHAEATAKQ
jgi:N-acetylmuramoyl-L-alanine amidase